jgi:uncharacterized repeat protein (TIGR01451 family)
MSVEREEDEVMNKVLALVLVLLSSFVMAQSEPVTVKLEAYVVSVVTKEDGTTEEQFAEAKEARPGQVVEYRVVVTNVSDETLPASNAVITGPIPSTTVYIADSATASSESARLEYSADGGQTFSVPPVMIKVKDDQGQEVEVAATPEQYTAARWIILQALEPKQETIFKYRVTVK